MVATVYGEPTVIALSLGTITVVPIRSTHTVLGLEWQVTKKVTALLYGGDGYNQREAYTGPGNTAAGYGFRLARIATDLRWQGQGLGGQLPRRRCAAVPARRS